MGKVVEYIGDDINDPMVKSLVELNIGNSIEISFIPGNLYRILVMVGDDVEVDYSGSYKPVEFKFEVLVDESTFRYVQNIKRIIRFLCGVKRVDYFDNLFIPRREGEKIYIKGSHNIDFSVFKPFTHTFLGGVGWYNKVLEDLKMDDVVVEKVGNFLIAEGWYDVEFSIMDNIVRGYKERYSVISSKLSKRCREKRIRIIKKYRDMGVIMVDGRNALYLF